MTFTPVEINEGMTGLRVRTILNSLFAAISGDISGLDTAMSALGSDLEALGGDLETLATRVAVIKGLTSDPDSLSALTDYGIWYNSQYWRGLLAVVFDHQNVVSQVALSSSTPSYSGNTVSWVSGPCVMVRTYSNGSWSHWDIASGGTSDKIVDPVTGRTVKQDLEQLAHKVGDVNVRTKNVAYADITMTKGAVVGSTGANATSDNFYRTPYIDIDGYEKVRFLAHISNVSGHTFGYAFYSSDSASSYISGKRCDIDTSLSEYGQKEYDIEIPTGAKYFRCCIYKSFRSSFYLIATSGKSLSDKIQVLEAKQLQNVCYVSNEGNDENDGSKTSPKRTITAALQVSRNIVVRGGVLEENGINFSGCDGIIQISSYPNENVIVFAGEKLATSDTQSSGSVYMFPVSADPNAYHIYQYGLSDPDTLISEASRHSIHGRREYRCDCCAINRVSSMEELTSPSDDYTYHYYYENGYIYYTRPSAASSSNFIFVGTDTNMLKNCGNCVIKLVGINFYGAAVTIKSNGLHANSCSVKYAKDTCWTIEAAIGVVLENCEACCAEHSASSQADGFATAPAHDDVSLLSVNTCNVTMTNCWSHDNTDDGYGGHYTSDVHIFGGLFEYNGTRTTSSAGICPAYGSTDVVDGAVTQFNSGDGMCYWGSGESGNSGHYGVSRQSNVISRYNGGAGFRIDGAYNLIELYNCISIGNYNGYSNTRANSLMTLIRCEASNNRNKDINTGSSGVINVVNPLQKKIEDSVEEISEQLNATENLGFSFRIGDTNVNTGAPNSSSASGCIRTKLVEIKAGTNISVDSGYQFKVSVYSSSSASSSTWDSEASRAISSDAFTAEGDIYAIIVLRKYPIVTPPSLDWSSHIHVVYSESIKDSLTKIDDRVTALENPHNDDYYHGPWGLKPSEFDKGYYVCGQTFVNTDLELTTEVDSGSGIRQCTNVYDDVIEWMDTLMALSNVSNTTITKTSIGTSSNNKTLYEYVFSPKRYASSDFPSKQMPIVLIDACIHGFEKNSFFGWYAFLKDMLTRTDSEQLDAIARNIEIHFVPVSNPYGFDNNSYFNANHVNLNRNFGTTDWESITSGTDQSGDASNPEPFDQLESQAIRDWILAYPKAMILITSHTNGRVTNGFGEMNACMARFGIAGKYFDRLADIFRRHITTQTQQLPRIYNLDIGSDFCGRYQYSESHGGTETTWGREVAMIPTMTLEMFNGLRVDGSYVTGLGQFTNNSIKCCAEIAGNLLLEVLTEYAE